MALTTLADYKVFASISSTGQDAQITALIPAVEEVIENYLGYTLGTDGTSQRFLVKREQVSYPLESTALTVTEVTYQNTGLLTTTPRTLDDAEYFVSDIGILTLLSPTTLAGAAGGIQDNGILVVTFNQDTNTVPTDLQLAANWLLRHYLKNEVGRESVSINGQSIDYMSSAGFPGYIRGILDLHRLL